MSTLYQQMIIDHSKNPRGKKEKPQGCCVEGNNPMCGDEVKMCVTLNGDRIEHVEFNGSGCSLSIASASVLCEVSKGLTIKEFDALMTDYLRMAKGEAVGKLPPKLKIFNHVSQYPMRVKCITIAWHACQAALKQKKFPFEISMEAHKYWLGLVHEVSGIGVWIRFEQKGCFGWQFNAEVVKSMPNSTEVFHHNGLQVYLDEQTVPHIQGTKISLETLGLNQVKVVYKHPEEKTRCGCGESFVIEDAK